MMFLPTSTLEIIFTLLEIAFGIWLYSIGYSGAAGLLVGGAVAAFVTRRMTPYHMAMYASQLLKAQKNAQPDDLPR
jgi:hypothetical protein